MESSPNEKNNIEMKDEKSNKKDLNYGVKEENVVKNIEHDDLKDFISHTNKYGSTEIDSSKHNQIDKDVLKKEENVSSSSVNIIIKPTLLQNEETDENEVMNIPKIQPNNEINDQYSCQNTNYDSDLVNIENNVSNIGIRPTDEINILHETDEDSDLLRLAKIQATEEVKHTFVNENSIFIKNLDKNTSKVDIITLFKSCGKILSVSFISNKKDKQSKNTIQANVEFSKKSSVDLALMLNETVVKGKKIFINRKKVNKGKTFRRK